MCAPCTGKRDQNVVGGEGGKELKSRRQRKKDGFDHVKQQVLRCRRLVRKGKGKANKCKEGKYGDLRGNRK